MKIRNKIEIVQRYSLWVKITVLLVVSFVLALWYADGWLKTNLRKWQNDSEAYVLGRIYQMQTGVPNTAGFLLMTGHIEDEFLNGEPIENPTIYQHNIGVQGTILGWINRGLCLFGLPPVQRLSVFYVLVIWSFFAALGAVCYWILSEFGGFAAVFCAVGTMLSPWTQSSIGNFFWLTSLYFLPFLLAAFLCRRYENVDQYPWGACLLISAGCLIRFLTGFEFASTTLICMEVPILYYWVKHPRQSRKWFRVALWTGIFGLLMFVAAMLIWLTQLTISYGDFVQAWEEMLNPIAKRTGAFADAVEMAQVYAISLEQSPLEVMRVYLQNSKMLGSATMQQLLILYLTIITATAGMCLLRREKQYFFRHMQIFVLCLVAFLAPVSWFVLARGHAAIHTHIVYILWLFPLIPCILAHMGFCFSNWGYFDIRAQIKASSQKA